jgi:replicative DNA helicase
MITDWINNNLYPSLFDCLDTALPELNLESFSKGWRSSLKLDLSNSKDNRKDKTVIGKKYIGRINEWGGANLSIVDYVISRDSITFIEAVNKLANIVGLQVPKGDYEDYKKDSIKANLLEEANSYFTYSLETSDEAKETKDYLLSRGYTEENIKDMELGYVPSQDRLTNYLLSKGHSKETIDNFIQDTRIFKTHKLSIPYRTGAYFKGFKFRTTGEDKPKYINSTGLDKSGGFFNLSGLKGDKDLVIVEGELDSLHASVKGVENVVSIGGSKPSPEQIRNAIQRGAKAFSICLDREPHKEEETTKIVNEVIEIILNEGVNKVYIVTLPDLGGGKTDPDRLIKERGVDSFKEAIKGAKPYYKFYYDQIISKYLKINEATGTIKDKEEDLFIDEIVSTGLKIKNPIDRSRYISLSLKLLKPLGITEDIISITIDKLQYKEDTEQKNKELKRLLSTASDLQAKGQDDKALELLDRGLPDIKVIGAKDLLPPPMSFTTLLDNIATLPPAYKTGYNTLDSFIGFTTGAISLIAGRPSHGKTTFMFNLLLQMSNLYKDEKFYFFTYEEPIKNISVKLLNRLIDTDLSGYFREVRDLAKPTNYEFIKSYIKNKRTDIKQVEEGKRQLQELIDSQRITVIDRNYSVEQLSSLITYLNKKEQIGALFIDYIQRINTDKKTQDTRTKIAHISDSILQTAKNTGLPIILGAQLNRATTESKGGKPKLENLKEAGNLEEDANTVISVYCEAREQEETQNGEQNSKKREVELEIKTLKNREGEVNTKEILYWDRYNGVIKERSSNFNNDYFK